MKRPEGFDPPAAKVEAPAKKPGRKVAAPSGAQKKAAAPSTQQPATAPPRQQQPRPVLKPPPAPPMSNVRSAKADLRHAARERKRFEKGEVRRFTRRARSRRTVWLTALALVVVLIGVLAVAVYSPILALRTITITGNSRLSSEELHAALDDQLGTPLALIDFSRITTDLGAFPLIRSYTTASVPPDTLVVTIVERQPVGVVAHGAAFDLVDPAGIVVQSIPAREAGVPLITAKGGTDGTAFASVVEVLLALPAPLLAQVDSVTALTQDDVTLTLAGVGQKVSWGGAEKSAFKARVLAGLIAQQNPKAVVTYDVSAPNSPVVAAG